MDLLQLRQQPPTVGLFQVSQREELSSVFEVGGVVQLGEGHVAWLQGDRERGEVQSERTLRLPSGAGVLLVLPCTVQSTPSSAECHAAATERKEEMVQAYQWQQSSCGHRTSMVTRSWTKV